MLARRDNHAVVILGVKCNSLLREIFHRNNGRNLVIHRFPSFVTGLVAHYTKIVLTLSERGGEPRGGV